MFNTILFVVLLAISSWSLFRQESEAWRKRRLARLWKKNHDPYQSTDDSSV